jgi:hypothetical protein
VRTSREMMAASRVGCQRQRRQKNVKDRVPEDVGPAGERRKDRFDHRRAAADRRQPAERYREGEHQEKAEPIDWHRDAELCQQHRRRVDDRALPHRGEDAQRHADESREEQCHHGELDGRADAAGDDLAHRGALEDRAAHVAMEELPEVRAEPNVPGVVQPQRLAQIVDHLARGLWSQQHRGGIARDQQQQAEGDDHHADGHRDQQHQPADHIGYQRAGSFLLGEDCIRLRR